MQSVKPPMSTALLRQICPRSTSQAYRKSLQSLIKRDIHDYTPAGVGEAQKQARAKKVTPLSEGQQQFLTSAVCSPS